MATPTLLTAEQFDRLPEDELRRFELIQGQLVEMPSPRPKHSKILIRLVARLEAFLSASQLGGILIGTDLALDNETRFRPGMMIFRAGQYARVDDETVPVREMPAIVVEILSPNDEIGRLDQKIVAYLAAGIEEVWTIDAYLGEMSCRTRAGARMYFTASQIFETPILPGWTLKIAELFA